MPDGFKIFTVGETLTAADMNNFVMEQVVGVYTSASNRDAELTAPAEGQVAYLTDTNDFTVYDGATWNNLATSFTLDEVGTAAAEVGLADQVLSRPEIKDWAETIETHAAPGASETLDLANGNVQTITLDAATVTLTFSNPPATGKAGAFTLIVTQDATGGRLISWPASVDWPGGTAPTLSSAANAVDIFTFITTDAGTIWYGMTAGQDFQ